MPKIYALKNHLLRSIQIDKARQKAAVDGSVHRDDDSRYSTQDQEMDSSDNSYSDVPQRDPFAAHPLREVRSNNSSICSDEGNTSKLHLYPLPAHDIRNSSSNSADSSRTLRLDSFATHFARNLHTIPLSSSSSSSTGSGHNSEYSCSSNGSSPERIHLRDEYHDHSTSLDLSATRPRTPVPMSPDFFQQSSDEPLALTVRNSGKYFQ